MTSDAPIHLQVNGEERTLPPDSTLLDLLAALDRHPRTVAVEHNGEIVKRELYGETRLGEGDRVEVVGFVQGG